MARVFLSLGSNLGDRRGYLDDALRQLGVEGVVRVVACSPVYETEPWPEQRVARDRWYLNRVVEVETRLPPRRLLQLIQDIEVRCGRVRGPAPAGEAYAPRTLDIDILFYGDEVISEHALQIPHPLLHERRFILTMLADLDPAFEHPTLYQPVGQILAELMDDDRGIFPYRD
jgi:2-amino-4-hydroxy-6-hydroxymethyldihydropteridine diphosphokinase